MALPRPFALIHTVDQWRRAGHHGTALSGDGEVELGWTADPGAEAPAAAPGPAGLAFDPWCRLYRSLPEDGRIERLLWAAVDPLAPAAELPGPSPVIAEAGGGAPPVAGDFAPAGEPPPPLATPRGLAVDAGGRLFVAESGAGRVLVFDLRDRRLVRRVGFPRPGGGRWRPLDLAIDGRRVWVALAGEEGAAGEGALAVLEARTGPRPLDLPAGAAAPCRLAVAPAGEGGGGGLYLLTGARTEAARVVPFDRPGEAFEVPWATDLDFTGPATLVVARRPGEAMARFAVAPGERVVETPLTAKGYDGRGIAAAPDGRVAFWSTRGLRHAVAARLRYATDGRVYGFRLDAGEFQTVWGRLFIDACIPRDTAVRVACVTADEPPVGPEKPRQPPPGAAFTLVRPDLSPPLVAEALDPAPGDFRPLHRRAGGRELPWVPATGELATWEAPIDAPPGRYLWVTLELTGNTRFTPRVASLRAEHPGHDLLRRLPKVYSRQPRSADFLRRFLAPLEGTVADLDARATARRALLDPASAPPEALDWLASLVGLALDQRWPEPARRRLIAEAAWLFRFRGTLPGLVRLLALYLDREPILIEHYRVRGLGGAIVGAAGELGSQAVLGAGFRVGGAVGERREVAVLGTGGDEVSFDRHAHRFTVVVPASLDAEQLAVVEHLLEEHRPAHTLYDLCTVDAGMRAGIGLYAGLTSAVGRGAGFAELQLGGTPLGRTALVGRPAPGTRPEGSRAGLDSRVG
jgi:phage tail-like protein